MRTLRPSPWGPGRLLVLAGAALAGCQPAPDDGANDANAIDDPVVNLPVPRPAPPMDRAALLTAVARAASAAASGAADSAAQRELDGRLFEFRIRFGCRGPVPDLREAMFGWSRDPETGTLRLRATPTISRDNDIVEQVAIEEVEEVEGFWIPRPWLLSPACPAAAAAQRSLAAPGEQQPGTEAGRERASAATERTASPRPDPVRPAKSATPGRDVQETVTPPPAYPKVGIAQFYTETDPRTQRRSSRPYEAVKTVPPEQPVGAEGFNLVLSGRLRAIPGKGVIHCVGRGADAPPDCIVSADIDKVWIEQPGERTPLAEWGGG